MKKTTSLNHEELARLNPQGKARPDVPLLHDDASLENRDCHAQKKQPVHGAQGTQSKPAALGKGTNSRSSSSSSSGSSNGSGRKTIDMSTFRRFHMPASAQRTLFSANSWDVQGNAESKIQEVLFNNDEESFQTFVEEQMAILAECRRVFCWYRFKKDEGKENDIEESHLRHVLLLFLQTFVDTLGEHSSGVREQLSTVVDARGCDLSFELESYLDFGKTTAKGFTDVVVTKRIESLDEINTSNLLGKGAQKKVFVEAKSPFTLCDANEPFNAPQDELMIESFAASQRGVPVSVGILTDMFSITVMRCERNDEEQEQEQKQSNPRKRKRDESTNKPKFNVDMLASIVDRRQYVINLLLAFYLSLGGRVEDVAVRNTQQKEEKSAKANDGHEGISISRVRKGVHSSADKQATLQRVQFKNTSAAALQASDSLGNDFDEDDEDDEEHKTRMQRCESARRWNFRHVLKCPWSYLGRDELHEWDLHNRMNPLERFLEIGHQRH